MFCTAENVKENRKHPIRKLSGNYAIAKASKYLVVVVIVVFGSDESSPGEE